MSRKAFLVAATVMQSAFVPPALGQTPDADTLRLLARAGTDSALVAGAKRGPLALREALGDILRRSVTGPTTDRDAELTAASRLSTAYAQAWGDSFLVRQVARFTALPPAHRATKVRADSLRRAGAAAYSRRGPAAAMTIWRRALLAAASVSDSAGIAGTLGNLGAGWSALGRLDSAQACLDRARALASRIGDLRVEANALGELAGISEARDDIPAARAGYARTLALRDRTGDSRGLAADYNNLGLLAQRVGDMDDARREFEAALALNRRDRRADVAATNLVNLAGLASVAGDFRGADTLYREALTTWRARDQRIDVAQVLHGLGQLSIRRGDYPVARRDLLEALSLYERNSMPDEALSVRKDLAGALAASGQLQAAIDDLRHAQRQADSTKASAVARAGIALARADLSAQLNAHADATRWYAAAQLLYQRARDRAGEAEAQQGQGQLLLSEDDAAGAKPLFEAALATQLAAGNRRGAAVTRLSLGQVALLMGDTATARRRFIRVAQDLDALGDPIAAAAALGARAALEAASGAPVIAESLYVGALARAGDRLAPQVTWELHAGLGALRKQQGALAGAAAELSAAILDIERAGESLALAERRSGFLGDKAAVYLQLAMVERARGHTGAAFEVSERVRAREMLELLAQGRVGAPSDTAHDLAAREQDLRRQVSELTRSLEGDESAQSVRGPDLANRSAVTREALVRAQSAYTDLLLEMREQEPRRAALVSHADVNWRTVAHKLAAEDAFIEYLVGEQSTLAFVVTRDTVAAVGIGLGQHALSKLVDFVRGTLTPRGSPRLDSLWRAPLRNLHQQLVTPLEESGLLAGKTRLTIVPHGDLHYLPFAALLDAATGRYLIERYEVTMTPSAAVWLALGDRPTWAPGAQPGGGILAYAPRPAALPASQREVEAIARLGGSDSRVVVGSAATEDAFRRDAPGRRVLHLATFGIFNKQNPLFSFIDLAPGGSGGEDGRLEVHEVFGLRLSADLVVLSACQTALGSGALVDLPAGDDWVGLSRAFLTAGAARVVASLWAVQDQATATLMEQFYREYTSGAAVGHALAMAQRALLAVPATAHPFYWAGFVLVGQR